MVYMTSWEVVQLCHTGTSAIRYGDTWVLRNYGSAEARVATAPEVTSPAVAVQTGDQFDCVDDAPGTYMLPPGVYQVAEESHVS